MDDRGSLIAGAIIGGIIGFGIGLAAVLAASQDPGLWLVGCSTIGVAVGFAIAWRLRG